MRKRRDFSQLESVVWATLIGQKKGGGVELIIVKRSHLRAAVVYLTWPLRAQLIISYWISPLNIFGADVNKHTYWQRNIPLIQSPVQLPQLCLVKENGDKGKQKVVFLYFCFPCCPKQLVKKYYRHLECVWWFILINFQVLLEQSWVQMQFLVQWECLNTQLAFLCCCSLVVSRRE